MRVRFVFVVFVVIQFFSQIVLAQKPLRPRGFAGLGYRHITPADVDSMRLSDSRGVIVNRIVSNTPADRVGFHVGDVLKKYDDRVILDDLQFVNVYQAYYAGDEIKVTFIRNGEVKVTDLTLAAFPREKNDELEIEYTSFPSKGVYLRAVITSPLKSGKKRLPALFIVSALGSPRLIASSGYSLQRDLAYEVSKAGFRVLRFEQRGFGDSEGKNFRTMDFNSEVEDNLAALDYLMHREDVDENRVFVFGHSTGGIVAALVASETNTAGVIPSCTIGRTYYERVVETLRLQGELGGDAKTDIDKTIKKYMNLLVLVAQGDSLSHIIHKHPEVSSLVNSRGRIMDDRTVEYWNQKLNLNLAEIYSKVTEPVLIVYGTSDFITQRACHENIQDFLISSGNRDVSLKVIPNLDHAYGRAMNKKVSFENYKTRNFEKNPEVYGEIVEWLLQHQSIVGMK